MASSAVQIANLALTRIGQKPITSLDDTNNAAIHIKVHYDDTRRAVLRTVPWKFALRRAELAELVEEPLFEWDHAYQLPSKALYVVSTSMDSNGRGGTGESWAVEGRQIVTNAGSPIRIVYIEDVTDVALFDALFVDAFAERLAAEIVYGITKQGAMRDRILQVYAAKIENAAAVDGQQGTQDVLESNQLIDVRA